MQQRRITILSILIVLSLGLQRISGQGVQSSPGIVYASSFAGASSQTGGIQEAIDSLPVDGGIVVIPPGTTTITQTISIRRPVTLRGYGAGGILTQSYAFQNPSTIKVNVNDGNGITISLPTSSMLSGINLENFQIQGNADYISPSGEGCGIAIEGGSMSTSIRSIVLDRVLSRDNHDCGFLIQDNAFMITFRDCQAIRNGVDGIRVSSTAAGGKVSELWLNNVVSDMNTRDALRIEGNTGDVNIYGGSYSDSGDVGLNVLSGIPGQVNIFGSHFEQNLVGGVSLGGGTGHTVIGNYIGNNGVPGNPTTGTGISIYISSPNPTDVAAILEGNQINGSATGIWIAPGTNTVVMGPQANSDFVILNRSQNTQVVVTKPAPYTP